MFLKRFLTQPQTTNMLTALLHGLFSSTGWSLLNLRPLRSTMEQTGALRLCTARCPGQRSVSGRPTSHIKPLTDPEGSRSTVDSTGPILEPWVPQEKPLKVLLQIFSNSISLHSTGIFIIIFIIFIILIIFLIILSHSLTSLYFFNISPFYLLFCG